ncbi:hypothetical protein B0A52_07110 [Exophiala mesophila]|uniref:Zn(2)-C6 fungal-type domain-containing protein n=1 Tax=Exophiala mesophila TaxID=212818 RepID=A0A438MZK7_EXOME|nr:hypothetical protein B0A52_07110 [Exophiala mesophila]
MDHHSRRVTFSDSASQLSDFSCRPPHLWAYTRSPTGSIWALIGPQLLSFVIQALMGPTKGQTSSLAPRRSRASAACTGCRQKRKKCVTQPDEPACDHCKDSGLPCVFLGDDERRKPRSRHFTQSLLEHIELLESRLKEVERESPRQLDPSLPPPRRQTPSQESVEPSILLDGSDLQVATGPDGTEVPGVNVPSHSKGQALSLTRGTNVLSADEYSMLDVSSSDRGQVRASAPSLQSLLFTTSRLQYSSTTGQLSFLGPVERLQHYGDGFMQSPGTPPGSWHMQRRLSHIISELDQETYDYLMTCFWSSYNDHLKIIDQDAFQQHEIEDGDQLHYSTFLHLCCLAMGFTFADKSRLDVQALIRGNRDSIFHGNARYMVEPELKKPHRLSTIQSLLLLSHLECAGGNDSMSWMYAGLACRFAFEIGLTLDHSKSSIPQREIENRHSLLQACVFYDRMWATISGHPTVIGRSDLLFTKPSYKSSDSQDSTSPLRVHQPGHVDMQSCDALWNLMDLATKVPRHANLVAPNHASGGDPSQLLATATLHEELQFWQKELPAQLRWNPEHNPNLSLSCLFLQ